MQECLRKAATLFLSRTQMNVTFWRCPDSLTCHVSTFPELFTSLNSMHFFQTRFGKEERIQNQTRILSPFLRTVPPFIA